MLNIIIHKRAYIHAYNEGFEVTPKILVHVETISGWNKFCIVSGSGAS